MQMLNSRSQQDACTVHDTAIAYLDHGLQNTLLHRI